MMLTVSPGQRRPLPGEISRIRRGAQTTWRAALGGRMSEAIWRWSATRVAAAIRSREISAREAIEASLSRMAAVNSKINAVTVDLSDDARAAADRADRAVA